MFRRLIESKLVPPLLILAALAVCVWPGMQSPLFSDDIYQIDKSRHAGSWSDIFQTDVFSFFRPAKNLIFMLAAPFEHNLMAWHMIGLAAYLAAAAGVFVICRTALGSRPLAWLATAAWVLSPTCVSTAVWLSCANISIGIAFTGLAFCCHERSFTARSSRLLWFSAALLAYAAALLCYETMIAVPGLLFLRDLQQQRIRIDRQTLLRYAGYALLATAFLITRHTLSAKGLPSGKFHAGFAPDTTHARLMLSAPWFLWRHFLMWAVPPGHIEILGSYAWLRSASAASLAGAWAFLAALLATAALTWKRAPAVSFGLLFFVTASIPSGNFLPLYNGPINDAYLTLPSIGLVITFAAVGGLLYKEWLRRKAAAQPGAATLAILLAVLVFYRIPACAAYFRYWAGVWRDPTELCLLMTDSRPYQFQLKGFTSMLLLSDGYLDPARELATETIRQVPWSVLPLCTLARIAIYENRHPQAEEMFRRIVHAPHADKPMRATASYELAGLLAQQPERIEEAAGLCRGLLKTTGGSQRIRAAILLARIYDTQGKTDQARATLTRGLQLHPGHAKMAQLLAALDRGEKLPVEPLMALQQPQNPPNQQSR